MATNSIATNSKRGLWGGGAEPLKASYGKLMMWFFLVSDALTFSGFLTAYGMVRYAYPSFDATQPFKFSAEYWPIPEKVFAAAPFITAEAPLVFVGIMTFILILSSVTMVLAVEAGHRGSRVEVEKWMIWTILGGLAFLGCQAWEWIHFIGGTGPESPYLQKGVTYLGASLTQNQYGPPPFADFFFFITGFHGTHVLSGVALNVLIFYNTVMGVYERRGHYEMVEKVGLYWHFVDLVWVFVFTFFYLV